MTDLSISAIIPLYNGARWIQQALESVFAQTLPPDEIIVIDDGSTDNGPAIVQQLAQDRAIRLLHKPNGGQSAARNFGIAHSEGALIALLDQDDIWYPNHLATLRAEVEKHHGLPLGWVYSDFDDIDGNGNLVDRCFIARGNRWENPKRSLRVLLREGAVIQPSATLISRAAFDVVGGFDDRLCGYEDDDLFLRLFRARYDNVFVPFSTSQWRIHDNSCGASERMEHSLRYYIQKQISTFPNDKWRNNFYVRDYIAPRFITIWLHMYARAWRYQNYAKMREYAREALTLVPLLGMKPRRVAYSLGFPFLRYPAVGMAMITMHQIARRISR